MDKKHALPSMEYRFKLATTGKETKINWTGEFLYKRPTLAERGLIEVLRGKLNGDLRTIDPDISFLHAALAHLRHTLKEYPEWWETAEWGGDLYDTNVVTEVYEKCIEFEVQWRDKVMGGNPKDVEEKKDARSSEPLRDAEANQ